MKRTTKHMKKTLAYLEKAWRKYPDLRLCQLIVNATTNDPFFIEDGVLIVQLKKFEKFWDKGGYTVWQKADQL